MAEDAIDSFIDKKKAESAFLSMLDGKSVRVKTVKSIKPITKVGFGGDEVECLRVVCVVETEIGEREKNFDNSSARFAKELKKNNIKVGSSFVLTREGEGPSTTYKISDVGGKAKKAVAAVGTPTSDADPLGLEE